MQKITKISFMRKLKEFDSTMILSISNEGIESVISDLDIKHSVIFDRSATFSGSNVIFTFLKDGKLNESHLNLSGTNVFFHNDFYIVVDKYENVEYILVYKISDKKTLNFEAIEQAKIDLELKYNHEREVSALEKIKHENESYFSHRYFNKEKIAKLIPIQLGRLKKALDKQFRFDGVVMTLKENLESLNISDKEITDKMSKWNRVKFNKFDYKEQNEYEEKLRAGKLYHICFDGYTREISKIVFDVLVDDFSIVEVVTASKNDIEVFKYDIYVKSELSKVEAIIPIKSNFKLAQVGEDVSVQFNKCDKNIILRYLYANLDISITKDNIALYYEFMCDEHLEKYSSVLDKIFLNRSRTIVHTVKLQTDILKNNQLIIDRHNSIKSSIFCSHILGLTFFRVKDTLKPINKYISDIKASSEYKEYVAKVLSEKELEDINADISKTLITIETPKDGSYTNEYDVQDVYVDEKDAKQWVKNYNRENQHNSHYAMIGRR